MELLHRFIVTCQRAFFRKDPHPPRYTPTDDDCTTDKHGETTKTMNTTHEPHHEVLEERYLEFEKKTYKEAVGSTFKRGKGEQRLKMKAHHASDPEAAATTCQVTGEAEETEVTNPKQQHTRRKELQPQSHNTRHFSKKKKRMEIRRMRTTCVLRRLRRRCAKSLGWRRKRTRRAQKQRHQTWTAARSYDASAATKSHDDSPLLGAAAATKKKEMRDQQTTRIGSNETTQKIDTKQRGIQTTTNSKHLSKKGKPWTRRTKNN